MIQVNKSLMVSMMFFNLESLFATWAIVAIRYQEPRLSHWGVGQFVLFLGVWIAIFAVLMALISMTKKRLGIS